jgi:hypothetical protein
MVWDLLEILISQVETLVEEIVEDQFGFGTENLVSKEPFSSEW